MPSINLKKLNTHRARTFRLPPSPRVASPKAALDFVKERGFIYFWPIKGIDLPSLWTAVAGNRVVADKHDDPGHITWGWKDNALDKKTWYYAKILRKKATMISLDIAPYFYALSENYGSPEEDYLLAYDEGRLTQAAKQVYEALLNEGALNTIDLRRAAKLANAKESEFNKALEVLQSDFKILPIGVSEAGAWKYSFIYEIVPRHYPDLPERARKIGEREARTKLIELYFESVGAAQESDANKLFGWKKELTARTIRSLIEKQKLVESEHPKQKGKWLALPKLIN
ncbi:MAG: winged helix DNA-binding domain-containing protein [Anaerolineae bacterium]|nr:winged helix DNA-binding domain-containing protein [Anaerolineae bacterium]MCI0608208.1 winged helix DNA-binding domain-containing protein [Anaerolineae bacterium]